MIEPTYEQKRAMLEQEIQEAWRRFDIALEQLPPWIRELIDPRMKRPKTRVGRLAKWWRDFAHNVQYEYRLRRAARAVAQARARYRHATRV